MAAHGLAVDEASRGSFNYFKTEVGSGHELENHVEHSLTENDTMAKLNTSFIVFNLLRLASLLDGDDDHDDEPGVGFEELDNVRVFEHVADRGLSLQVVQGEAG